MTDRKIYFDNAATSFPKPEGVTAAMCEYMENVGCNINRGSYAGAYTAAGTVFDARSRLKALFGAEDEKNIIFTPSDTYSLNMLIKGIVRQNDHIAVSSMEHNAVMRPVEALAAEGKITYDVIACDPDGSMDAAKILEKLEEILNEAAREGRRFRAVALIHGSNICGSVLPIEAAGRFCREHDMFLIVDCAQTAGYLDIDMKRMNIDGLSFSGHKGLLGPQGTGGFAVSDRMAAELETVIEGGTGSFSHLLTMPEELPDRFEAGTMNIPGIYGLYAGLKFLEETGIDVIRRHEQAVTERFLEKVRDIPGVRIAGYKKSNLSGSTVPQELNSSLSGTAGSAHVSLPVVSLWCDNIDPAELAYRLESEYGIWTRVGLHCAPMAHKTLGTFPKGTVRFSFGYYNTLEEAEYGAEAIRSICERG
ncbi:MAG: aminotransferase class V-fold PLP-dependent enzyme [Lachnospiraceae bacterium]|nr:aminotransferase class V-fold PLP-dependent enzyme [Lachnospiraceae bacterium]